MSAFSTALKLSGQRRAGRHLRAGGGLVFVVKEAEVAGKAGLEGADVDCLTVQVERDLALFESELHRIPAHRLERQRLGSSAVFGLVDRVVGGKTRCIAHRACHPVQLHTGGITQECESIDRRMDHHLTGLVEKLVGEHIAVAQGAKIIEPALICLGCGSGGLALCDIGQSAAAVDHSVCGGPVEQVDIHRLCGRFRSRGGLGPRDVDGIAVTVLGLLGDPRRTGLVVERPRSSRRACLPCKARSHAGSPARPKAAAFARSSAGLDG